MSQNSMIALKEVEKPSMFWWVAFRTARVLLCSVKVTPTALISMRVLIKAPFLFAMGRIVLASWTEIRKRVN